MITKAMFNNVSLLSRRRKKATKQVYMQLLRLHQIHTEKKQNFNYKNSKATSITTRRSLPQNNYEDPSADRNSFKKLSISRRSHWYGWDWR